MSREALTPGNADSDMASDAISRAGDSVPGEHRQESSGGRGGRRSSTKSTHTEVIQCLRCVSMLHDFMNSAQKIVAMIKVSLLETEQIAKTCRSATAGDCHKKLGQTQRGATLVYVGVYLTA